ncbi:hypothetical protein N7495_005131 [Penicillium taxi]|uniref:uncharacterized protein n=1 Tax=Penicillium taxi TaxID=168475 RepID=UPI002544EDC9|nr:uncharacterized protein N7495_005131 [Penicillium taxi]KAJ5893440.1 hypothetical protein N7495_005131 [Penicillium taxi]
METVNNVIQAASTAIWGENSTNTGKPTESFSEEPISGVQGKGIPSDPYDAGNRDEQLNAPASIANTAHQEQKLDGKPLNALPDQTYKPTEMTPAPTPTAVHGINGSSSAPLPTVTPAPAPGITAPSSILHGLDTSRNLESEKPSGLEQRNTGAHNTGANEFTGSGSSSTPAVHPPNSKVSTEALKGPQGPAPHSAEEFKKKPVRDPRPVTKSNTVTSNGSDSSKGSEKSQGRGDGNENGNEKHGAMAKMKERLSKATHTRHSSK